jgi:squalene cyclase
MSLKTFAALLGVAALLAGNSAPAEEKPDANRIRQSVNLSLPLLEKSLAEYPHHTACFSCHHQGVPMLALSLARKHGYAVEGKSLADVVQQTSTDLRNDVALYRKGQGQPGGVTRAGYALLALESGGVKSNELTEAVTGYLLQRDKEQGYWRAQSNRPPAEASGFTNTFLSIRALKTYGVPAAKENREARIAAARTWLEQTPPKDTEDSVFRLWAMQEAGSEKSRVQKAAKDLLAEQKEDGGWAQKPGMDSDAYATGCVLTALAQSDSLPPESPEYQRGIAFLLKTQQPDGSWHVVTRSKPVQPYFESGFPYGKDQFISIMATGWATAALVLAEKADTVL